MVARVPVGKWTAYGGKRENARRIGSGDCLEGCWEREISQELATRRSERRELMLRGWNG